MDTFQVDNKNPNKNSEQNASNLKRRRMVPVVDARFQWKYTLIIAAIGMGVTAIMGYFLYGAHKANTGLLDLGGNEELRQQILQGEEIFLIYLVLLVVVMGLALTFWGLIVTHRVAGPVFVVARHLQTLKDGHYPDVRPLRQRDEMGDFFQTFDDTVKLLKGRDEAALALIKETIALIQTKSENDSELALKIALTALRTRQKELSEILDL